MEATSRIDRSSPADEAVARVRAYLRGLGLPADRAQAEAAAVVGRCEALNGAGADLTDAALADVMARWNAWLEELCRTFGSAAECSPGLLAWCVRPALAEDPNLFLRRESLGEVAAALRRAVGTSARPALPEPAPTSMPVQSFGPAPSFLQLGYWRGLVARAVSVERSVARRLRGG
jgi:hypothetical protein